MASRVKFGVLSDNNNQCAKPQHWADEGNSRWPYLFFIGKIYQQPDSGGDGVSPPVGLSLAFLGLPGSSAADCGAVASSELSIVRPTLSFLRQRLAGDWLFALPPTLLLAGLAVPAAGDGLRGLFYRH